MIIKFHCTACEMGTLVGCAHQKSSSYDYLNLLRILPPIGMKEEIKALRIRALDSQSSWESATWAEIHQTAGFFLRTWERNQGTNKSRLGKFRRIWVFKEKQSDEQSIWWILRFIKSIWKLLVSPLDLSPSHTPCTAVGSTELAEPLSRSACFAQVEKFSIFSGMRKVGF